MYGFQTCKWGKRRKYKLINTRQELKTQRKIMKNRMTKSGGGNKSIIIKISMDERDS